MNARDWRRCGKKRRYDNLETARQQREFSQRREGKPLKIYQCDRCDGWHLTSQNVKAWGF